MQSPSIDTPMETRRMAAALDNNPWTEIAFLASPPGPAYSATVVDRMAQHAPPYRALPARKDEQLWYVVGAPGWNMLGVLMRRERAEWAASLLNRVAALRATGGDA